VAVADQGFTSGTKEESPPLRRIFFLILDRKLATLGAFCMGTIFTVQLFGLNAKSGAFRLGKLLLHACREQNGSKHACWKL